MQTASLLAMTLWLGCVPASAPAPAPAPASVPVVSIEPPPSSAQSTQPTEGVSAPTGYDDRCVRAFTDERGTQSYDFSCAWRNEARAMLPDAGADGCIRRFVDDKGFVRYDSSCSRQDAMVLETAARKEACTARGGEWGKHGWYEFEGCAWHAKDAGKPCRDRTECESRVCLAPASASRDKPTSGGCSECVGDCAISGLLVESGFARARIHEN